eukprot:1180172-Prorocentrum_minimum.AAC.1
MERSNGGVRGKEVTRRMAAGLLMVVTRGLEGHVGTNTHPPFPSGTLSAGVGFLGYQVLHSTRPGTSEVKLREKSNGPGSVSERASCSRGTRGMCRIQRGRFCGRRHSDISGAPASSRFGGVQGVQQSAGECYACVTQQQLRTDGITPKRSGLDLLRPISGTLNNNRSIVESRTVAVVRVRVRVRGCASVCWCAISTFVGEQIGKEVIISASGGSVMVRGFRLHGAHPSPELLSSPDFEGSTIFRTTALVLDSPRVKVTFAIAILSHKLKVAGIYLARSLDRSYRGREQSLLRAGDAAHLVSGAKAENQIVAHVLVERRNLERGALVVTRFEPDLELQPIATLRVVIQLPFKVVPAKSCLFAAKTSGGQSGGSPVAAVVEALVDAVPSGEKPEERPRRIHLRPRTNNMSAKFQSGYKLRALETIRGRRLDGVVDQTGTARACSTLSRHPVPRRDKRERSTRR